MIEYKTNDSSKIKDAIATSVIVMGPPTETFKKHYDPSEWQKKIDNGGLFICALDTNEVVGFAVCYKKSEETFHIWNVGVKEEYRGQGLWRSIYNQIEEFATQNNYRYLTVHTFEKTYPAMYAFLMKENFEITDIEDSSIERGIKTKFKKTIIHE